MDLELAERELHKLKTTEFDVLVRKHMTRNWESVQTVSERLLGGEPTQRLKGRVRGAMERMLDHNPPWAERKDVKGSEVRYTLAPDADMPLFKGSEGSEATQPEAPPPAPAPAPAPAYSGPQWVAFRKGWLLLEGGRVLASVNGSNVWRVDDENGDPTFTGNAPSQDAARAMVDIALGGGR